MKRKNARLWLAILLLAGALVLAAWAVFLNNHAETEIPTRFDGDRAYQDVIHQTDLGPRTPGSQGHAQVINWIQSELREAGWQVEIQESEMLGHPIKNIIAKGSREIVDETPLIILGAHYDTRLVADEDPDPSKRSTPVPGANDGASGVAVLLELARVVPKDLPVAVWLVFFDAEDNGRLPGWDWILGSRAFVSQLEYKPEAVVIVDMIGDADLNIYQERNSDAAINRRIFAKAAELGYTEQFIPTPGHRMLDDHTPFLEAGIPAVDLIDFDYPYWHTTGDTADKVSAQSLQAVGDTILGWLKSYSSSSE
jgi:hypothetical protein